MKIEYYDTVAVMAALIHTLALKIDLQQSMNAP